MNFCLNYVESQKKLPVYYFECKNNLPIGLIGLYDINNIHRNCEVGLYIGDEDYLNMGIGTDALKLIEEYAKNYLNIRKISLSVVSENIGAVSFWEKTLINWLA
ncbi:GNAT family N-acetyltransferase [Enterococcus mundtii]|nr:GNAT family N-acetyltransferase [Enterococcus mundtii]